MNKYIRIVSCCDIFADSLDDGFGTISTKANPINSFCSKICTAHQYHLNVNYNFSIKRNLSNSTSFYSMRFDSCVNC